MLSASLNKTFLSHPTNTPFNGNESIVLKYILYYLFNVSFGVVFCYFCFVRFIFYFFKNIISFHYFLKVSISSFNTNIYTKPGIYTIINSHPPCTKNNQLLTDNKQLKTNVFMSFILI